MLGDPCEVVELLWAEQRPELLPSFGVKVTHAIFTWAESGYVSLFMASLNSLDVQQDQILVFAGNITSSKCSLSTSSSFYMSARTSRFSTT